MTWRVVLVSKGSKADFRMNQMIIRSIDGEQRIYLQEIAVVIFETTAIAVTACLLHELVKHKIRVIFCDDRRNPEAELCPYHLHVNSTAKIRQQLQWDREFAGKLWQEIVRHKIAYQAMVLRGISPDAAARLEEYATAVQDGDPTNREAHAAKIYFRSLFGREFARSDESHVINHALNYGYTLILSAISRELAISGCLLQLGIFHDSAANPYNLSSDFIEPLRPLVDYHVCTGPHTELDTQRKRELLALLDCMVRIEDMNLHLLQALRIYCNSLLSALNQSDLSLVRWIEYEF